MRSPSFSISISLTSNCLSERISSRSCLRSISMPVPVSSRLAGPYVPHEGSQAKRVALGAEAGDGADADGRDPGAPAEGLARVHVREVDLDGGQAGGRDRVAYRDRGVRVGARVEEQPVEADRRSGPDR